MICWESFIPFDFYGIHIPCYKTLHLWALSVEFILSSDHEISAKCHKEPNKIFDFFVMNPSIYLEYDSLVQYTLKDEGIWLNCMLPSLSLLALNLVKRGPY